MKNKIKALICVLALILTSLPGYVSARSADDEQLRSSLAQLGILSWTPMSKITKGAFVYSLAGFLYDDVKELATAEQAAKSMGLIDEKEKFDESARITTNEALKYAVKTLGYRQSMEDAEYASFAAKLGISSGISLTNRYLENDDGLKILENLLDAHPINAYITPSGEIVYETQSDETLLSKNRHIHRLKGIVTANRQTSIYSDERTRDGFIKIDGNDYVYRGSDELLGQYVLAYVREERGEDKEIIYIGAEPKNNYLTIETEDVIDVADNFSKIRYDNGRVFKNAKLALSPKVIYNGIFCGNYTKNDFMGDNGNLKLIDYDDDGMFDVIFITAYETVVVSSVDSSEREITNRYTYAGALTSFKINDEDDCVIYKNTDEVSITDIKAGDVLSVAISKNTARRCITVYVSDKKAEGVLKSIDEEEKNYYINDAAYKIKKAFSDYMKNENKSVTTGKEYSFSLDVFGNPAAFEKFAENGYVLGLRVIEDDNGSYMLVYMDMNGDWHNGIFAKKVRLNDTLSGTGEVIYNTLRTAEPQIMIIGTNAAGEIKTIETALNSGAYNKDRLTKSESTMIYRSQSLSFNHSVHLEDDAKLVVFPSDITYDKDGYYVKDASGYFSSDGSYTVTIYDVDEFNFTPLLSIRGTGSKLSRSLFVVTKVMQALGDDGDIHSVAYGNIGNFRDFVFLSKGEHFVDASGNVLNIKAGDIINVSVDRNGYVDEASIVYSLNQPFVQQGAIAHNSNSVISGIIEELDSEKLRMRVRAGGVEYVALSAAVPVQVYRKSDRTCELKTVYDLKKGSKVVMQFNWGAPIACVVVEE